MGDSVVKEYTSTEKNPEDLELNELDEKVFLEYRQKRIAEMTAKLKVSRFGEVAEITGKDYVQEVNKAGDGIWVVLHLYKQGIPLCTLINEHMRALAIKYPAVKFIKSLAGLCIPNYPDHNLPTIFIYLNGELKKQLIGPLSFTTALKQDELEWQLSETGAFKTDLESDPRPKIHDALFSKLGISSVSTRKKMKTLTILIIMTGEIFYFVYQYLI